MYQGFPGSSAGKESTCNAGDLGSIPGLGRSPGEENSNPLQYSGLENFMDCLVLGVTKSWTQLSDSHFTPCSRASQGKESTCQFRRCKRHGFNPWVGKIPRRRKWQFSPVFSSGESHGPRRLVGYSPWGCKESVMSEQLNTHPCSLVVGQSSSVN